MEFDGDLMLKAIIDSDFYVTETVVSTIALDLIIFYLPKF